MYSLGIQIKFHYTQLLYSIPFKLRQKEEIISMDILYKFKYNYYSTSCTLKVLTINTQLSLVLLFQKLFIIIIL